MLSRLLKMARLGCCALLLTALVSLGVPASAQKKGDPTAALYVVTYVDVYPNFAEDTTKTLRQFAADSRKDPGFVRFEFLRDVERINHFSIVEVWQNRQAYETHLTQDHSKQFRVKLQQWLGSPFDERLYNLGQ